MTNHRICSQQFRVIAMPRADSWDPRSGMCEEWRNQCGLSHHESLRPKSLQDLDKPKLPGVASFEAFFVSQRTGNLVCDAVRLDQSSRLSVEISIQ